MLMRDTHWCEAGINGGNPDFGRESRLAELDMDRYTNLLLNRRQVVQAHPKSRACSQNGTGWRAERIPPLFGNTLIPIPANSKVLRPTSNGNQERDNPLKALQACLEQVVSRMPCWGRIASEANARGKAVGYADGGTVKWQIEM